MTKRADELHKAWEPNAEVLRKLRRLGLRHLVHVRMNKKRVYKVTLVLTQVDSDPAVMLDRKKRDANDEIGGITIEMDCNKEGLPSADAVTATWMDMAKTSSTYLTLRTLQQFWD